MFTHFQLEDCENKGFVTKYFSPQPLGNSPPSDSKTLHILTN